MIGFKRLRDTKPFKRHCKFCDTLFQPTGRKNKVCDECKKKQNDAKRKTNG